MNHVAMILLSAVTTTVINGTTSIIATTTSDSYEISLVLLPVVTIQW